METFEAAWVIEFAWPMDGAEEDRLARLIAERAGRGARAMRPVESPAGRLYLPASSGTDAAEDARRVAAALPNARPCRLQTILEIRGASAGAPTAFHYVVETDVLPECEQDFNAWYDREHLAGLAAVPGTIRAVRYLRLDGSPKYGAFYELVSRDILGSPAWLEVRATAWSSRVRPAFRNTTRVMYAML